MLARLDEERRQRGRLRRLQRQQASTLACNSKALDFSGDDTRLTSGKDAHPNRSEHAGCHRSTASPHFESTAVAEQLADGGIRQMDQRACRTNDRQISVGTDLLHSYQQALPFMPVRGT